MENIEQEDIQFFTLLAQKEKITLEKAVFEFLESIILDIKRNEITNLIVATTPTIQYNAFINTKDCDSLYV